MVQAITDANRHPLGLAPSALVTISADTAINYTAIQPTTDVNIYYITDVGTTTTLNAGTGILVHENLRLAADTVCFVV